MKLAKVKAITCNGQFMNLYVPEVFMYLGKITYKNFFLRKNWYLNWVRTVYNWENVKLVLCGFAVLDDYGNIKVSWLFRKGENLYAHRKWNNKR